MDLSWYNIIPNELGYNIYEICPQISSHRGHGGFEREALHEVSVEVFQPTKVFLTDLLGILSNGNVDLSSDGLRRLRKDE